jgi:hypothetical protein
VVRVFRFFGGMRPLLVDVVDVTTTAALCSVGPDPVEIRCVAPTRLVTS